MAEDKPSLEQQSFVSELDDVAEALKTTLPEHAGHEGWALRSTSVLVCGCGGTLYAPEAAGAVDVGGGAAEVASAQTRDGGTGGREQVAVHAPQEIDVATADTFSRDLSQAFAAAPERVVVDFARTTFCDSTALRLLVNAARQAHASGCRLELVHPPRQLLVMAEILGVSDLLRLSAPPP
jgi:anti-anti-sigma factor